MTFSAEGGTEDADGRLPISAFVTTPHPAPTFMAVAVVHGGGWEATSDTFGPEVAVTTALMARSHDRDDHKKDKHKKDKHHKKGKHAQAPEGPRPRARCRAVSVHQRRDPGRGERGHGGIIDVTITYGGTVVTVDTTGQVLG